MTKHALLLFVVFLRAVLLEAQTTINFDSINTSASPYYVDAGPYLAGNGISLGAVTPGTRIVIVNDLGYYGGQAVRAPSAPNTLTQIGSNAPVSFTLNFATPLDSFAFKRSSLIAASPSGVTHPRWSATAYGGAGAQIGASVGEGYFGSYSNVPGASFMLNGPAIVSVRFDSQNLGAGFSAVVLDDFVLSKSVAVPPSVTSFSAKPATISAGKASTLFWTTANATSVSISGLAGTRPANGSVSVTPGATTTYTLTARGAGGTATATTVIAMIEPRRRAALPPLQAGETAARSISAAKGGAIALPRDGATVTFAPQTFVADQNVTLTSAPESGYEENLYTDAISLLKAGPRARTTYSIRTGTGVPEKDVLVHLNVPATLLASLASPQEVTVFSATYWQSDIESLESLEPLQSSYDPATGTVTSTIPVWGFTDLWDPRLGLEALLVIGSRRLQTTASLAVSSAAADDCPFPGRLFSPIPDTALGSLTVRSPYGERDVVTPDGRRHKVHDGVDIHAPTGTPIGPVASGKIVELGYSSTYGQFVVVEHEFPIPLASVRTLYAHLETGSIGNPLIVGSVNGLTPCQSYSCRTTPCNQVKDDGRVCRCDAKTNQKACSNNITLAIPIPVTAGSTILGLADSTPPGGVTDPHLHFEISQPGKVIPDIGGHHGRIDPKQCGIGVPDASLPTVLSFGANPATIKPGESSVLSWTTSNATSVSIGGISVALPPNGSVTVSPAVKTTYMLTATGTAGMSARTVTVTVNAARPTIVFAASPATINAGQSSTLTWSTTGATSISISGVSGAQPPNGSLTVSPAVTTTYTLTATGPGGTAAAAVTVTVQTSGGTIVTGTWLGTAVRKIGGFGNETDRVQWKLMQLGTSVTGTYVTTVTSCESLCPDPVGTTTRGDLVDGAVSGSTLRIFSGGDTSFVCTVAPSTMTCTIGRGFPGTLLLTRQ